MAQALDGSGAEEVSMATTSVVAMDARCPLCGSPILSFGQGGRVVAEDLHAVPLHRRGGARGGNLGFGTFGAPRGLRGRLGLDVAKNTQKWPGLPPVSAP